MRPTLSNKEQQIIALCKGLDWRYDKFDNTTEPYVSNDIIYVPARVNLEVLTDLVNEYSLRQCRLILEKLKRKLLASDFECYDIELKDVTKKDTIEKEYVSPWYALVIRKIITDYTVHGNQKSVPMVITYYECELHSRFDHENEYTTWNNVTKMINHIKNEYEQLEQKNIKEWRDRNERLRIEQEKEAKIKSQVKDEFLKIINSFDIGVHSRVSIYEDCAGFKFHRNDDHDVIISHRNSVFDKIEQKYINKYAISYRFNTIFTGTIEEITKNFESIESKVNSWYERKTEPVFDNNTRKPWGKY